MIAGRNNTVVRKQAVTPIARSIPRLANPRYVPSINEPKPAIVVRDVSSIAFPVLLSTVGVLFIPVAVEKMHTIINANTNNQRKSHKGHKVEHHTKQAHQSDHPEYTMSQRNHRNQSIAWLSKISP